MKMVNIYFLFICMIFEIFVAVKVKVLIFRVQTQPCNIEGIFTGEVRVFRDQHAVRT
jgi:hypothetical protein